MDTSVETPELDSPREPCLLHQFSEVQKHLQSGHLKPDDLNSQPITDGFLPPIAEEKKTKKRKRDKKKCESSSRAPRPNYFIAVQVDDVKILSKLEEVQLTLVTEEPLLKTALVSLAKSHVTMKVFHAKDDDTLERAKQVLDLAKEAIVQNSLTFPLNLNFQGLSHFKNQVLFAQVVDGVEQLNRLAELVQKTYETNGFEVAESEKFKGHLTIAKLSKQKGPNKKRIKKIPENCYSIHVDETFGTQVVTKLQLLEMCKTDSKGYYHCVKEVDLSQTESSVSSSSSTDVIILEKT